MVITMIKAYIFDFGNVLSQFYPEKLTAPYVSDEGERKYLAGVVFSRKIWEKLDDGSYSDEDAKREICKELPEDKHEIAERIYDGWIDNMIPVPGMTELVSEIADRGEKRLYLLSNINTGFASKYGNTPWIKKLLDRFDGLVFSGKLGIVKPSREIFEYLLGKYGLSADECVFIDDSEHNVLGARAVGINAYLFDGDAEKLRKYLEELN